MTRPSWRLRPAQVAKVARQAHLALMFGWIIMLPVSVLTGLRNSVPYLVGISVWALIASHASAWAAEHAAEQSALNADQLNS